MTTSPFWYRDFKVYFDPPPIPDRDMDWHFEHDDFDGAPDAYDYRCGHGATAADCCQQINDMMDEIEAGARPINDLSDDRDALASAGIEEGE